MKSWDVGQCLGLGFWSFEGQEFFFFFCSDLFIFYKENAIIRPTAMWSVPFNALCFHVQQSNIKT